MRSGFVFFPFHAIDALYACITTKGCPFLLPIRSFQWRGKEAKKAMMVGTMNWMRLIDFVDVISIAVMYTYRLYGFFSFCSNCDLSV